MAEDGKQEIIKYVMKYDGCSQAQIINYMRGSDASGDPENEQSPVYAAGQTTLNMLDELTGKKGNEIPILITIQSKKNRRYLNYHVIPDLRSVYEQLNEIDSMISVMDYPIHKLYKLKFLIDKLPEPKRVSIVSELFHFKLYGLPYIPAYSAATRTMLYYLFEKWSVSKVSKEQSNIIYGKIIELMRKLNDQTLEAKNPMEDLEPIKERFLKLKEELDSGSLIAEQYFRHKTIIKLLETLDNFNKRFSK